MKLQFSFKHLDHSDALQSYTQEAIEKIAGFLLKEGTGKVWFSKQRENFYVEITISTHEKHFKAEVAKPDIYVAVDLAIDKLEKQFLKVRKQMQHHKKYGLSKEGKLDQMIERLEPQRNRKSA